MKIRVNLASKPYVDVRSIVKQLRILMAVFVLLALPLWLMLRSERNKAEASTARVEAVENGVQRLEQQQQSYQALMRQPQNAAVLTQSDFLNSLFRRKAFSWTATMTDLETVLPSGVQVLSIDPEVSRSGEVAIRLRVSGARDRSVELVRNLEKSRHFAYPRLTNESVATSTGGPNQGVQQISSAMQVNFEIFANYRPLSEAEEKADKTAEDKGGEQKIGNEPAQESKPGTPHTRIPGAANAPKAGPGGHAVPVPGRRGAQ
jgi:type IV pilus assembly protein PilN